MNYSRFDHLEDYSVSDSDKEQRAWADEEADTPNFVKGASELGLDDMAQLVKDKEMQKVLRDPEALRRIVSNDPQLSKILRDNPNLRSGINESLLGLFADAAEKGDLKTLDRFRVRGQTAMRYSLANISLDTPAQYRERCRKRQAESAGGGDICDRDDEKDIDVKNVDDGFELPNGVQINTTTPIPRSRERKSFSSGESVRMPSAEEVNPDHVPLTEDQKETLAETVADYAQKNLGAEHKTVDDFRLPAVNLEEADRQNMPTVVHAGIQNARQRLLSSSRFKNATHFESVLRQIRNLTIDETRDRAKQLHEKYGKKQERKQKYLEDDSEEQFDGFVKSEDSTIDEEDGDALLSPEEMTKARDEIKA